MTSLEQELEKKLASSLDNNQEEVQAIEDDNTSPSIAKVPPKNGRKPYVQNKVHIERESLKSDKESQESSDIQKENHSNGKSENNTTNKNNENNEEYRDNIEDKDKVRADVNDKDNKPRPAEENVVGSWRAELENGVEPRPNKAAYDEDKADDPRDTMDSSDDDFFISESFDSFLKNSKEISDGAENRAGTSSSNLLNNIKVDLSSIEIVNESDPMQMMNLENMILNDKPTKMITLCQSSYTAEMSALKSQEIQSLVNSDSDFYSFKKKLYQYIHRHIESTSVGKLAFGDFLHVTSYFDLDTLLYGIYCQTFQYKNKYSITCPSCRHGFDAIVNNDTLIETRGSTEEVFAKINDIIGSINQPSELIKNSHVHKTKRIILDESKIIFDIRIPSVFDFLEGVVAHSDNDRLEEYQNSLGLSLFIHQIYIPDLITLRNSGNLKYIKRDMEMGKMIDLISNLTYYDSEQLSDEINDFVDKYRIAYSIKNVRCPHCGHEINTIPLDMETVLFSTIRRGRSER